MQACRVLRTVEFRMYCMTAPWGPVAPNALPRRAMRLVDVFLLIVADRPWVADQAGSFASVPGNRRHLCRTGRRRGRVPLAVLH